MRKIKLFAILFVLLFAIGIKPVLANKKITPRIVVGADLTEYKRPTKKQCDINVPEQYPTIKAGVDVAVADDTVCVRAGIYNEDYLLINKPIKLVGNGFRSTSTINSNNSDATVFIYADNVVIEGFVITGNGTSSSSATVLIGEAGDNITLRNNYILAGNGTRAIRADGGQNNNLIQNNIIAGNNSPLLVSVSGTPLNPSKPSNQVDFINNTFIGTVNQTELSDSGVVLTQHATNSLIERNIFATSGSTVRLIDYAYGNGTGGVRYNNFNSATVVKVYVSTGTLNAENNWWGDLDPSDNFVHDVDFTPFAVKPFRKN